MYKSLRLGPQFIVVQSVNKVAIVEGNGITPTIIIYVAYKSHKGVCGLLSHKKNN